MVLSATATTSVSSAAISEPTPVRATTQVRFCASSRRSFRAEFGPAWVEIRARPRIHRYAGNSSGSPKRRNAAASMKAVTSVISPSGLSVRTSIACAAQRCPSHW